MFHKIGYDDEEWLDIVNKDNQVIAQAKFSQIRLQLLRHRAIYVVIHNGMHKILIQRSTDAIKQDFCHFNLTVEIIPKKGEKVLHAARRGAEEKLGIIDVPFANHGVFVYELVPFRIVGVVFSCISRGPFTLSEKHANSLCWMDIKKIPTYLNQFTPDSYQALTLWMKDHS